MKNKYVASFLSFFIGAIGAHKFYLGDNKRVCLFSFSWTGVPALLGIFESIKILKLSENDFETYYKEYIRYYDTASKDWDKVKEVGFGDLKESFGWIDILYKLKRDGIITDGEFQEKKKQLESLFKLKSDKILTDQEYQEKKDAILNRPENIFSYTKISDPEKTIQNGDIIIGIGDHVISESTKNQKVLEDFFISWNPSDPILIKVLRGGVEKELNIPFEHIPIEPSFSGDSHSSGFKNLSDEEFLEYNDDLSFLGMCDNYIEYLNEKRLMGYSSDQKNQNTIEFEQSKKYN